MKTIIYYFTGTGNSLAAAKKIAAATGDCELVPIASLEKTGGDIVPQAERVGIVCPVYFSGIPLMVASFTGRLDPAAVKYLFAVVTNGGGGESAALRQLDTILRERKGRGLDAGFGVVMPGNYIMMYRIPERKKAGGDPCKGRRSDRGYNRAGNPVRETRAALFAYPPRTLYSVLPVVQVPCPYR